MFRLNFKVKIIISLLTVFINIYCIFIILNMWDSYYSPTAAFSRIDLNPVLSKIQLDDRDYSLLFNQTGLGRTAIDELRLQKNCADEILSIQNRYFSKARISSEKLNPFTIEESVMVNGTFDNQIAPIKNGDILLTKSAHTLYWRHGHCAVVIDAKKGITLESLEPGTVSMTQNVSKWLNYPTFKLLRLKNADQKIRDEIAVYAAEKLSGVKYKILAAKEYEGQIPEGENCSQLIWLAFNKFGYDLDSNKGVLVTPEDIAKCDLLEVVQIYGFNPKKAW